MKSALFVDFDNVYSQLRQLQPEAAERFARQPAEWIDWLVRTLDVPPDTPAGPRRLLVRCCYLNPAWYQGHRAAFLRAGFEIIDCPPVTSQGKTSTDIHMVLDIVDLLQHETRFDEFIVFSADADFTPVLRKLRRHDRRTTVLAIGHPSAAYQAAADLLIDEGRFLREALHLDPRPGEPAAASGSAGEPPEGAPAFGLAPAAAPTAPARPLGAEERSAIAARILAAVEASPRPLAVGPLAGRLKAEHPAALADWGGHGSFRPFFESLGLTQLVWLSGSGGRLLDPSRHEPELPEDADAAEAEAWAGDEAALLPLAREICGLTGAPLLAPRTLARLMEALVADLAAQPFELNASSRRVAASLEAEGLRLRARDLAFLLRGLQLNGHVFGRGQDDRATLVGRLVEQMVFLCAREQRVLDAAEQRLLRRWLGAETPA